jgi:hypothetical protein
LVLEKIIQNCLNCKENNLKVGAKFYDLSKAFDTVHHSTLILKLKSIGFTLPAISLIESYLSDRKQSVFVNNSFSSLNYVKFGVPQGSILGPLLFLIYVNDLPKAIETESVKCYLFADDVCVTSASEDKILNFPSDILKDWCDANLLTLNLEKTQELNVSYNNKLVQNDPVKFLGIIIQNDLSWKSHINYIIPKVNTGIFLIRKLNRIVSTDVLLSVYYGYVHSHLTYGTILWANNSYCNSLFSAQKQALRAIFKSPYKSHCKPLFIKSNIMSLPCILIFQYLLFVKKNEHIFKLNSELHSYNTRHNKDIVKPYCSYSKTLKSFKCVSVKLFNKLPGNIRTLSLSQFKGKVKNLLIRECFYTQDEYLDYSF